MEESQQFRNKEVEILRRKNQELDRENLHLKKQLSSLEDKLKKGFDQEKEILDKVAQIPSGDSYRKIRDLMKEVNYWQERFSKSEAQLEEYKDLPRKLEDLDQKLNESNIDRQQLKKALDDTKEKLNRLNQQKARVEGELEGKGAQISKLNELETEKNNWKREAEDWKNKYEKLNSKYSDKNSLEGKYAEMKQLLLDRETRLKTLTNEIARLNDIILEKKSENDKLKGRAVRLDEIQLMYQKEREFRENEIKGLKSRLGDDGSPKKKMKNVKKEYDQKIEALKNELARTLEDRKAKVIENENLKKDIGDLNVELSLKDDLKEELEDKDKRIKATLEEVNRLNDVLGSTMSSYEKSQMKLGEYENKIIMLTTEIQRLNQMLRAKNEENDVMRLRFGEMDSKLQSQRDKFEEKIKGLNAENEKIKAKLKTSEAAKALEINHLKIKLDDFKKNEKEEGKIEPDQAIGKSLPEQNEDVKRKMKREILHLDEQNRILKEDNDHIKKQAELWKEELEKLEEEKDDSRVNRLKRGGQRQGVEQIHEELARFQLENNDLKARIAYMGETEELLTKKLQDIERLYSQAKNSFHQQYSEIDNLQKARSEHMMARGNIERDLQNIERLYEDLKYRYATLELESKMALQKCESEWGARYKLYENESIAKINQLEQYRNDYDKTMLEIKARERIDETFEARTVEYEEKVAFFAGECEKLKIIILDKEEEIQEIKAKLAEVENLDKQELQENLLKIKQMLEIKLNELDGVILQKQQLERNLDENREGEGETMQLREIIERKNLETKELLETTNKIEQIIREKDIIEGELTKLSRILENKIEENDEWREKYQRLEGLLSEKGGLEARYLDNEDKKMRILNEMDRLARESKQKSQENEQLLRKMRNLEIAMNDSINLQNEILRLKNILEEKLEEIDNWKSKCSRLEAIINDKESLEGRALEYERKIEILVKDIEKLGYVYREKTRENEDLKLAFAKSDAQISDRGLLETEIRKIKEILEAKLQEIDNLKARNSGLELAISNKDGFLIKSREYEEKIRLLSGELEKVSLILREKNEEIEGWRLKFTRQESNFRDRESLEYEIKKIRGILESKLQELEDLKALNAKYELKMADCQDCDGKLMESQRKMEFLHRELERISGILRSKQEENETLRLKCNRYETMIRDEEVLSSEFSKMKEILERKLSEIDQYKTKCTQYELRLAENSNEDQQRDCERKLEILSRELEKLSTVLKEKMEEIEDWRVKYSRLESSQRDSMSLQEELRRLSEILQNKLREIDEWRSRYAKLEIYLAENSSSNEKFEDYERKIDKLTKEIERLGVVLQDKMKENEEIRVALQRLETKLRDNEVLEKELRNMKEILGGKLLENDDLRANCSRLEYLLNEKGNYDGKLREYEDKISLLANELEKISRILSEKMEENEELRVFLTKEVNGNRDKDYLNNEIGRMKEVLTAKMVENDELRTKINQISILKNDLKGKEQEINILTQEINKLTNNVIPEKNLIIEQMRLKLNEKENLAQQGGMVYKDLEKMRELMNEKNKELENLSNIIANYEKNKAIELENLAKIMETKRLAHVETNVRANTSQIEEIKIKLKEALSETDNYRIKCEKFDELKKNYEELQRENHENREKESLVHEIDRLKDLLKEKIEEIDALKRNYLDGLQSDKDFLIKSLEKLSPELHFKIEENEQLKRDLVALKEENEKFKNNLNGQRDLINLIETLKRENEVYRNELDHNLNDQEKLRQDIENSILSEDNFKDLEKKLRDLKHDLEEKNRELEDWKRKYNQLEKLIQQNQGKSLLPDPYLVRQIEEWKEKYEYLQKEINNKSSGEKETENGKEMIRLRGLLDERTEELNRFLNILDPIREDNFKLRENINNLMRENEDLRKKLINPRMEGQLLEQNNEEENRKIKRLLGERICDIDHLNEKLAENELNLNKKQQEIEKFKQGMIEIGSLYKKDIGSHEKKNQELEKEIGVLKNLLREVENTIKNKNEENQELKKLVKSHNQNENLKIETSLKQKRMEELETRNLDLELEILAKQGLETKNWDYQANCARMNDQINALKNDLLGKDTEIAKLKERIVNLEHENFLSSLKRKDSSLEEIRGFSEVIY